MKPPIRRQRKIPNSQRPIVAAPQKSNVDVLLSRASSAAQVFAVLLAGFGYFYTVVPVFQNQKLQEDNAQLQLSNNKLQEDTKKEESKLKSLSHEFENQKKNLIALQATLQQERQNLTDASLKLKGAEQRESQAKLAVKQANEKLKQELSSLDLARWKIVMMNFTQYAYFSTIHDAYDFTQTIYEDDEGSPNFILNTKSVWPDYLTHVRSGLKLARSGSKEIPTYYFDKIEKHINEHVNVFSCPQPDFEALADQYTREYTTVDSAAHNDALEDIERQRNSAAKNGSTLLVKDSDIEMLKKTYIISREYTLSNKYRKIIMSKQEECKDILSNYFISIRQDLGIPSEKE